MHADAHCWSWLRTDGAYPDPESMCDGDGDGFIEAAYLILWVYACFSCTVWRRWGADGAQLPRDAIPSTHEKGCEWVRGVNSESMIGPVDHDNCCKVDA